MAARHMRRVALVGYGDIGRQHVAVLRDIGVEVVAACNRSDAGRQRARTEGGIGCTYAEIEDMLRDIQPDGVVCCPSLFQNFEVARRVIPFGIPMLLEKPPGTSLAELHELGRLARDHGTPVLVGVNRVWYSVLERAVQHAGGLDCISFVSVEWSESPRHLQARGFTPEQIDRRTVTNSLHGLAVLTHLAGAIPSPAVVARCLGTPHRWVVALQGLSERGVLGTFQSTWDSPAPWRLSFGSPARWYTFAPLEKCVVTTSRREPAPEIEPDETDRRYKPGLYGQARSFLALMNTGVLPDRGTLDSVVPAVELAEAITRVVETASIADVPPAPTNRVQPSVAITCGGVGNAEAD